MEDGPPWRQGSVVRVSSGASGQRVRAAAEARGADVVSAASITIAADLATPLDQNPALLGSLHRPAAVAGRADGPAVFSRLLAVAAAQTCFAVRFAVGALLGVFLQAAVRDKQQLGKDRELGQDVKLPSCAEGESPEDGSGRKHRLSELEEETFDQAYAPTTKCARAGMAVAGLTIEATISSAVAVDNMRTASLDRPAAELATQDSPCGSICSCTSSTSVLDDSVAARRLTVVLDLDDTLICSFRKTNAPARVLHAAASARPMVVHEIKFGRGQAIEAPIDGEILVAERPGLKQFLCSLKEFANVVLFTAGLESYAAPVVRCIDPLGDLFDTVLYRDATVDVGIHKNVKDLRVLGTDLGRTVLLDNSPFSFLTQPANGVPVLPFSGSPTDLQLSTVLLPLLQDLQGVADVRPALRTRYCVERWLRSHGCRLPVDDAGPRDAEGCEEDEEGEGNDGGLPSEQ